MTDLLKKVMKIKKLQKHGGGRCVTIPKSWRLVLGWTEDTPLILTFDPYLNEINIRKDEKINSPVPIAD